MKTWTMVGYYDDNGDQFADCVLAEAYEDAYVVAAAEWPAITFCGCIEGEVIVY